MRGILQTLLLPAALTASLAVGAQPQPQPERHAPPAARPSRPTGVHSTPPPGARPAPVPGTRAPRTARPPLNLDDRYHHDHYYPRPGSGVRTLPRGSVSIGWRDSSWYFHGGVWFRPSGTRFVVAVPPVGIVVPYLPPAYVTLWIGGLLYYYANGVYYSAAPEGFVVTHPPAGADTALPVAVPPTFVIYPRLGQDAAQTEADRAACNDWANAQSAATGDATVFQRAFEACMDGRGYTVR